MSPSIPLLPRRVLAGVVAAGALLAGGLAVPGGGAPAASAARPVTCARTGTTTIFATPKVRIYSERATGPVAQRDLFGCTRPAGRSRFLFDGATNETWSDLRIASERFVALADFRVVPIDGAHETTLISTDVRTGRSRRVGLDDPPAEGDFALLADGAMAYVLREYDEAAGGPSATRGTLYHVPFTGPVQTLDSGRIADLAVSGRTVYWTKDGAPQARRP